MTYKNHLKIIPLGGLGEIGRNMTLLEYDNNILIIDMGLQFPEEDMPGIDYIIPNTKYLEGKQRNIVGVVFSHGHYDHIGAVPYLVEKLGNPTLYAAPLTRGIILKRQEEFPNLPKLNIEIIKDGSRLNLGPFHLEFVQVNHNIPDDMAFFCKTPVGNIFYTSDFKFDPTPTNTKPLDLNRLRELSKRHILLLMSDSTGAESAGHSISENEIEKNLEEIFKKSPNQRIIAATFSSLINRIQQLINLAEKYNRNVIIEGYSMKTNIEISKELGYIKIPKGIVIKSKNVENLHPSKILVLCTGAQGEGKAVLMRIANKEHKTIRLKKSDVIIFSSSVIPGNERTVQILKDNLYRQGAKVYHYKMMDIHAGGHGQIEDLNQMIEIIKPKFFMPVHGHISMLVNHAEIAKLRGVPEKNIVIAEDGNIINLTRDKIWIDNKTVPSNYIIVDGLGVGDVGNVVLRDRHAMAEDGMFVMVVVVDAKTGKVKGSPDIISRGFVYLRESKELLRETRKRVINIVEKESGGRGPINWVYVKDGLRNEIGQFLFQKTKRRPMVLPVIIEI